MSKGQVKITRGTYGLWAMQHLDERWTLEARLLRQRDTLVIGEVRVVPRSKRVHIPGSPPENWTADLPEEGVPATILRKIALGEVHEEIRRRLKQLADWRDPDQQDFVQAVWLAGTTSAPRRPGRRGRDDLYYARIAALYVELIERGSRRPTADLADQLPKLTRDAVVQLVHEARNRLLLTKPPAGRSGGELTQKAKRLLGVATEKKKGVR